MVNSQGKDHSFLMPETKAPQLQIINIHQTKQKIKIKGTF
jgi:hypothetical protein